MSVGIRSTSQRFRWHGLIAGNGECCHCCQRKIPRERKPWSRLVSTLLKQGEKEDTPPPPPPPPPGGKEGEKKQGCPRLFIIVATDIASTAGTELLGELQPVVPAMITPTLRSRPFRCHYFRS